jgi:transaldolase
MATDTQATATARLHDLGQSLWLDNITRGLLTDGTLSRYIQEWSVTGLTSNPTIFDQAIENTPFYDDAIRQKSGEGTVGEALFFELALEDLHEAAELFRPVHDATQGLDGWVSLEVSPLLANDAASTTKEAARLHARAKIANLLIKIPGTPEGVAAIEESIAAGVPVNVTLLFSREQYLAAAHAINTIPDDKLRAFADHRHVTQTMPADGGDAEDVLRRFAEAGVDVAALAGQLQREGAQSFDDSWNKLMRCLASESGALTQTGRLTKVSS